MADLRTLEGAARSYRSVQQVDPWLCAISTPLKVDEWVTLLSSYPDKSFVDYILVGITEGFRIGYKSRNKLQSTNWNMRSALEHPQVVQKYLDTEVRTGWVLGLFEPSDMKVLYM